MTRLSMSRFARKLGLLFSLAIAIGLSVLATPSGAAPLEVKDGLGRVVTFNKPAKTVAYLSFYEAIPALRIWDQTVGLSRFAFDNTLMRSSNPQMDAIMNIGSASDINAEKLMKLRPDVVITRGDHPALVGFMAQKGLNVLAFSPHTIDEVWRDLRLQAAVVGKPEAANAVIHESNRLLQEVRVKVQSITKPKTVLWLWSKPTRIVGTGSVMADIMNHLKVNHPGSQYATTTPDVGLEKIVKINPDVILIWGTAKYSEADILNNPQWQSIKAVRNKQVFKSPNWGVWSPQAAAMTLWAATRIYPEHFESGQTQARIAAFHRNVFGVDITE